MAMVSTPEAHTAAPAHTARRMGATTRNAPELVGGDVALSEEQGQQPVGLAHTSATGRTGRREHLNLPQLEALLSPVDWPELSLQPTDVVDFLAGHPSHWQLYGRLCPDRRLTTVYTQIRGT